MNLYIDCIKKSLKFSKLEILYIISLVICFQTTLPFFGEINYFVRYIISFLWCVGIILYYIFKKVTINFVNIKHFILLFLPGIFIVLYTFILLLSNIMDVSYIGRSISCFVALFSPFLMLLIGYVLFNDRIYKISFVSIVASFILLFVANIIYYGIFDSISQWIQSVFISNSTAHNHFEVHDLTFACCELLIFICFFNGNRTKKYILFSTIFIIFISGFKRIALLSLCLIMIFMLFSKLFIKSKSYKFQKRFLIIIVSLFIISLFAYIWLIDSGALVAICNKLNINTMDRIHFYTWLSEYFDFSPFYLGQGFGATSKLMNLYNPWGIQFGTSSIHSEVLRLYFELGFIGFFILMLIYFCFIPKYISKKSNNKMVYIYLCVQFLLFLFHLTDNTFTYFTTQYIYGFIVMSLIIPSLRKKWSENDDG